MTPHYPIHVGESWVHEKTGTIGKVIATTDPENRRLEGIEQTLRLEDGSKRGFPYLELRRATPQEEAEFSDHRK